MQNFDLNHIATLAVLLRTCSVSQTARQLGTSSPTVSRALAQLRAMAGDELLVRTGTGMQRTARAEALIEPVERWLAGAEGLFAQEAFDPAALTRTFRIATTDYGMAAVLAPAISAIAAKAPA